MSFFAMPFSILGKIRLGAPQLPGEGNLAIVEVGNEEQNASSRTCSALLGNIVLGATESVDDGVLVYDEVTLE